MKDILNKLSAHKTLSKEEAKNTLINISIGFYLYLRNPNRKAISFLMIFFLMMLIGRFYISFGDIEKILTSGSPNYISIIALSGTALYYTFVPERNRTVNILPALVANKASSFWQISICAFLCSSLNVL